MPGLLLADLTGPELRRREARILAILRIQVNAARLDWAH